MNVRAVSLLVVLAGCGAPSPAPVVMSQAPVFAQPLSRMFVAGQSTQSDVLRVMGAPATKQVVGVRLNADGAVPGMSDALCTFPNMTEFPQLTAWIYSNVVVPSSPGVVRSACFLFNADGGLLELRDRRPQ